jgi:hypothetical protein
VVLPRLAGRPVASHVSAAILHGLPFCHSEIPPVHVTRPDAAKSRRGAAVRLHIGALRPDEVVRLGGLEVTTVERTVVDCALSLPFDHAVVLADAALRGGLTTRKALRAQLIRQPRAPGIRRAAAVVDFADPRSAGPGESFSRVQLRRWGFPAPELGVATAGFGGPPGGRMAFGFPGSGVLGAFEPSAGPGGRDGREGVDAALWDAGWRVVRWWWPELRDPEPWAGRLADALGPGGPRQGATVMRTRPGSVVRSAVSHS